MSAEPCSHSDECRCHCGSLLARIVDGAVELKCRRCKRTHRVPIEPETLHESAGSAGANSSEMRLPAS